MPLTTLSHGNVTIDTSAVGYQLKFAYHDTAHLVLQYTLGIGY